MTGKVKATVSDEGITIKKMEDIPEKWILEIQANTIVNLFEEAINESVIMDEKDIVNFLATLLESSSATMHSGEKHKLINPILLSLLDSFGDNKTVFLTIVDFIKDNDGIINFFEDTELFVPKIIDILLENYFQKDPKTFKKGLGLIGSFDGEEVDQEEWEKYLLKIIMQLPTSEGKKVSDDPASIMLAQIRSE